MYKRQILDSQRAARLLAMIAAFHHAAADRLRPVGDAPARTVGLAQPLAHPIAKAFPHARHAKEDRWLHLAQIICLLYTSNDQDGHGRQDHQYRDQQQRSC